MTSKLVHTVRPPSAYPAAFHEALRNALAEREEWQPVLVTQSESLSYRTQRVLQRFAHCFEHFPLHDPTTAQVLREAKLRITTQRKVMGHGVWGKKYVVSLRVIPDYKALINSLHFLPDPD